MKTLIATEIELNNQEGLFDIYQDKSNRNTFYAQNNDSDDVIIYKTTKDIDIIKKELRNDILTYCLGKNYDTDEEVSDKDVFMYGEYFRIS